MPGFRELLDELAVKHERLMEENRVLTSENARLREMRSDDDRGSSATLGRAEKEPVPPSGLQDGMGDLSTSQAGQLDIGVSRATPKHAEKEPVPPSGQQDGMGDLSTSQAGQLDIGVSRATPTRTEKIAAPPSGQQDGASNPSTSQAGQLDIEVSRQGALGNGASSHASGQDAPEDGVPPLQGSSRLDDECLAVYERPSVQDRRSATKKAFRKQLQRSVSLNRALSDAGLAGSTSRWVLNPDHSRFLQCWNIIAMLALAYVAVITPVEIAMLSVEFNRRFVSGCIIDLVFLIDLVLQFFIMYQRKTEYGFILEPRPSKIAKHYLKTWFTIDALSVIPFDLVLLVSESKEGKPMKAVKTLRLVRVLKLARVLRASRVIHRVETTSSLSYGTIDLLKLFTILLMIIHWLASLWALTLQLVGESDGIPRWIDSFPDQELHLAVENKDSPWRLYLTCFYFSSYAITSGGGIGPVNAVETAVATIMIIVAGVSWAIVIGKVCSIEADLAGGEQNFRRTMDELNFMMQDRVISPALRHRLRSFFLSSQVARRHAQQQHIIASMSTGLQGEVVMEINRRWIANVSFLSQFMVNAENSDTGRFFSAFLVEVSQRMECSMHAQSEWFGVPQQLYILRSGLASNNGHVHDSGSVWGVDFVLSDSSLIDPPLSYSLTYVELITLGRETFLELVEKHKNFCPDLKRRVRRFCCWLAFQRALLREAKLRRRKLRAQEPAPESRSKSVESASARDNGVDHSDVAIGFKSLQEVNEHAGSALDHQRENPGATRLSL